MKIKPSTKTKFKKWLKKNKSTLILFTLVFVITTGALVPFRVLIGNLVRGTIFNPVDNKILKRDMTPITVNPSSPFYEAFSGDRYINFLLLGVADKNTDTIMLCSYDTKEQDVHIISVPRDTYKQREGYKSAAYLKINSYYRTDGIVGCALAVSEILQSIPIHYYAMVEYEDLGVIMDAIGGVDVDIPADMDYDDPYAKPELHIHFKKGVAHIDSSNVMEFLRFRKNNDGSFYSGTDIARIKTQQDFVKRVIKECLKLGNITDVAKIALKNIDSDITYTAALKLTTNALTNLSIENIHTYTLPGSYDQVKNLSFWKPNDEKIDAMLREIFFDSSSESDDTSSSSETSK